MGVESAAPELDQILLTRSTMPTLYWVVAALALGLVSIGASTAWACTCQRFQPRLLIPQPGAEHAHGEPILVAASSTPRAFLYDSEGAAIPLLLDRQSESLGACNVNYSLFRPSPQPASNQELALLLTDEVFPDVAHTFRTTGAVGVQHVPISAAVSVEHIAVEPFEASAGFCHDTLAGSTVVGYLQADVTLSEPAPLFVRMAYDDASIGTVRQFASTIPGSGETIPDAQVRVQQPLTDEADGCFSIDLFDWTFTPLWNHRACLAPNTSKSLDASIEYRTANLPRAPATPPPAPGSHDGSCAVSASRRDGATLPLWLALTVAAGRLNKRRRSQTIKSLDETHAKAPN